MESSSGKGQRVFFLKQVKIIFLTIKSSPTGKPDRCFHYAPDHNTNRFEISQGFIVSNHFNAKQSVVSFKGASVVLSLNVGDSWIRTSTTKSLTVIRDYEEEEKGWKKEEIALPHEFKDLDAVHILSFVDLGRLLIVLVTRSIILSNPQYSLLMETDGRLVYLGSEWIGSRVRNPSNAICSAIKCYLQKLAWQQLIRSLTSPIVFSQR